MLSKKGSLTSSLLKKDIFNIKFYFTFREVKTYKRHFEEILVFSFTKFYFSGS